MFYHLLLTSIVSFAGLSFFNCPSSEAVSSPEVIDNFAYFVFGKFRAAESRLGALERPKRDASTKEPEIRELTIVSDIISRFGTVTVDSTIHNQDDDDKEVTFEIMLPEEAFISNFTMLINGEFYEAEVVSKEEAKKRYEEAREKNITAGLVENRAWEPREKVRGMERFQVSINIGRNSTVKFTLNYLELLRRHLGLYEQRISIRPKQIVAVLSISVRVFELQGIADWQVIEPYGSNSLEVLDTKVYERSDKNMLEINFMPSVERQKEMSTKNSVGLNGDFVIRYDVNHDDSAGLTQVSNGFFVHFFSPADFVEVLPKNVIFVIDISGSMGGVKIDKVRESMPVILKQLKGDDKFMLLLFDDQQKSWPKNAQLVTASWENIQAAIGYVEENVLAEGGTDINGALVNAAKYFGREQFGSNMIVFLTDGDPTSGETDTRKIQENVVEATAGMVSIFALGYGFSMNFDFLRSLSYRNNGMARRIYDDLDADLQLKSFFEEVGNPVLYDVKLNFPASIVSSVTQTAFPQYFAGSEIVIAGQLKDVSKQWNLTINAMSLTPVMLTKHITGDDTIQMPPAARDVYHPAFIEQLFVYMKIKDQLRLALMTDDESKQKQLREVALRMSLEYHLVTPVTSFIIVQQESQESMQEDGVMMMAPKTISSVSLQGTSASSVIYLSRLFYFYVALLYNLAI